MPPIHPELLDAVFYLYPSVEAATAGEAAGGTGVFVGVPIPELPGMIATYACSNKHVVGASGCSVMRINRVDGNMTIIDGDPADWTLDPHNDLAVIHVVPDPSFKWRTISLEMFMTQAEIRDHDAIGPGDEVFMTGRFINHDGKLVNVPSVRFGHLSMMPLAIRHPSGYDQESFAVEMLSRPGYSGSPVYVYRTPYDLRTGSIHVGPLYLKFLGLNWGFITDPAEVKEEMIVTKQSAGNNHQTIRYVAMNTGMNGVVPAWHLRRFLETGDVMKKRQTAVDLDVARRKVPSRG
jgi:hypothetical protein